MREFLKSAMYRFPAGSSATSWGPLSSASVASPPSPEKPSVPVPGDGRDDAVCVDHADPVAVGNVEIATGIDSGGSALQ